MKFEILIIFGLGLMVIPLGSVYGHGLGVETIPDISVNDKKISITVEIPMDMEKYDSTQITITAKDQETEQNVNNITYQIGLFFENDLIFREHFLAQDGRLAINVVPTNDDEIEISGGQNSFLDAWHSSDSQQIQLTGPVFNSGGLYHFEIEIKTIDEPTNTVEDLGIFIADIHTIETAAFEQHDSEDQPITFRMKSYFDKISNFNYNPEEKIVTFEMPFDWSEKTISHIPFAHVEVHFPKDFSEFLNPSYVGKINGIELFKSSVTIDDFTEEDERIVHFVLLQDHIRFLKNELKKSDEIPDRMTFTLSASDEVQFPLTAMTRNEQFQVDLSWDPLNVELDERTKFVFTIRDGATGEPLRQSTYDFVIIQGGQEIHRVSGNAQVGGGFEDYIFSEEQTGPTIIRFENIRGTENYTEFGLVVVPEFGTIAMLIFIIAMTSMFVLSKKNSGLIKN